MSGDDWWNCKPTVITLSAEDFDEFVRVMQAPCEPTPAALRGAKMLDELYRRKQAAAVAAEGQGFGVTAEDTQPPTTL